MVRWQRQRAVGDGVSEDDGDGDGGGSGGGSSGDYDLPFRSPPQQSPICLNKPRASICSCLPWGNTTPANSHPSSLSHFLYSHLSLAARSNLLPAEHTSASFSASPKMFLPSMLDGNGLDTVVGRDGEE